MTKADESTPAAMPPMMGQQYSWERHTRPLPQQAGAEIAAPTSSPPPLSRQIPDLSGDLVARKPIVGPPYIPPLIPRASQAEPQDQPAATTRAEAANHAPQGTARPSLPTREAGATTARDLTAPDPDAEDPEAQARVNAALVEAAERAKTAAVRNPVGPPLDWAPDGASAAVPLASGATMLVAGEQSTALSMPTAASASAPASPALGTVAQVEGGGAAASAATAALTPRPKKRVPPKAASKKAGATTAKHPARAKAPSRAAPKVLTNQTPEKSPPAGALAALTGAQEPGPSVTAQAPAGRDVLQAASETSSPKTARNKRKGERKERIAKGRPRAMKPKAVCAAPAPRPPSIAASVNDLPEKALPVEAVAPPKVVMVRIDELNGSKGPRRDLGDLTDLIASIAAVGVLHPIIVDKDGNIIAGHRRVAACRALGLKRIPAIVLAGGTIQQRLAAIDENLCRKDLNALERGEWLAERKVLYEELHPEARQGGAPGIAGGGKKTKPPGSGGFVPDTAVRTGRGRSTISEEVKIATIAQEVRDKLRTTAVANRKGDLLRLAKCAPKEQERIAERIVEGASRSVREAQQHLASVNYTGFPVEDRQGFKGALSALQRGLKILSGYCGSWASTPDKDTDPVLPLFRKTLDQLRGAIEAIENRIIPEQACDCGSAPGCPRCAGKGWLTASELEAPGSAGHADAHR
jgi:ParB family chromosome partitioning protein